LELAELDLCVMRLKLNGTALRAAVLAASLACAMPTAAQQPAATPTPDNAPFDVDQLFAGTCGFCHADGGRAPGRGPQLMDSPRDDEFIRNRIKTGKQGAMPAFGESFSDAQIDEIIKHIRALKPR
jgi:mono/diheme cytochrome c family protein